MYQEFLKIAEKLNKIGITPLLFGSLGLEQRLDIPLNPNDIDILIFDLEKNWPDVVRLMKEEGYELYDLHEHAFKKDFSVAFASLESLKEFANVDIRKIPIFTEGSIKHYLLDAENYLKVYKASLKDSYRQNKKNKKDSEKIKLIEEYLEKNK